MRAHEFIDKVTAYITDPAQANEVRRELEQHIHEATAEVEARGIDRETAELVAVARMGDPAKVAMGLAEAHHQHLPWRHYLSPLPVLALMASVGVHGDEVLAWRLFWTVGLIVCLFPRWVTAERLVRTLALDVRMKLHWLGQPPQSDSMLPGLATGSTIAFLICLLSWTPASEPVILLLMAMAVGGTVLAWWRNWNGSFLLHGAYAAIAFPLTFLAMFFLVNENGFDLRMLFMVSTGFALAALTAGYFGSLLQRRRTQPRRT